MEALQICVVKFSVVHVSYVHWNFTDHLPPNTFILYQMLRKAQDPILVCMSLQLK